MELVDAIYNTNDLVDDPLADEDMISEQLEALPILGRCHYNKTSMLISNLLNGLVNHYQIFLAADPSSLGANWRKNINVLEGKLAWMIYIVGYLMVGRLQGSASQEADEIDAKFTARILELRLYSDKRIERYGHDKSIQRLESAMLNFLQNFRKVYIGEHSSSLQSNLFVVLREATGLVDHIQVLDVIVDKLAFNLRCWTHSPIIIESTLNLFNDLVAGFISGKSLAKLAKIEMFLDSHESDSFPFLDNPLNGRLRTTFHQILARILFLSESTTKFESFMSPFTRTCEILLTQANSPAAFRSDNVKFALVGLFRDLRGVCTACNHRRTFTLFFDWLHPRYMPILQMAATEYYDSPQVIIPLLKLFAEIVYNKAQRLSFECSSPNGILLFREASKIMTSYGSRTLQKGMVQDLYKEKYKAFSVCFTIFARTILGSYVNFGVFDLYGDPCLKDALQISINVSISIPIDHISTYPKLGRAYYVLLELLSLHYPVFLHSLDPQQFAYILRTTEEGLKNFDKNICAQCCMVLDNLLTYQYGLLMKNTHEAEAVRTQLNSNPNIFPSLLSVLMNMILFEDSISNQWSISRPMLGLIVMHPTVYEELKMTIIMSQTQPDKQEIVIQAFRQLMEDVHLNLEARSKDRFTQNLAEFRHRLRNWNIS